MRTLIFWRRCAMNLACILMNFMNQKIEVSSPHKTCDNTLFSKLSLAQQKRNLDNLKPGHWSLRNRYFAQHFKFLIIIPESPSFNCKTLYTVIHSYAACFRNLRCNNVFEEFLNMHHIIASQYKGIIKRIYKPVLTMQYTFSRI